MFRDNKKKIVMEWEGEGKKNKETRSPHKKNQKPEEKSAEQPASASGG